MIRREQLILFLATWFGAGKLPFMPGTWGSLAALPLWWLLQPLSPRGYVLAVVLLGAAGIYLSSRAETYLQQADAPVIVIDEVVGQLICLAFCPFNWLAVGLGVVLFRLFDIVKPFPIRAINAHLHGGLGIVLDDVVAGLGAGLVLLLLFKVMPL
jgi:phosphatidylglycerophosphatase A